MRGAVPAQPQGATSAVRAHLWRREGAYRYQPSPEKFDFRSLDTGPLAQDRADTPSGRRGFESGAGSRGRPWCLLAGPLARQAPMCSRIPRQGRAAGWRPDGCTHHLAKNSSLYGKGGPPPACARRHNAVRRAGRSRVSAGAALLHPGPGGQGMPETHRPRRPGGGHGNGCGQNKPARLGVKARLVNHSGSYRAGRWVSSK